jgi:hypothetical protein
VDGYIGRHSGAGPISASEQKLKAILSSIALLEERVSVLSRTGLGPDHEQVAMAETKVARDTRINK